MDVVFRLLIHTLPLVPLAYGRIYLAIAAVLAIVMCYIKAMKLNQLLSDLEEAGKGSSKEFQDVRKWRDRWAYLTYLKEGRHY